MATSASPPTPPCFTGLLAAVVQGSRFQLPGVSRGPQQEDGTGHQRRAVQSSFVTLPWLRRRALITISERETLPFSLHHPSLQTKSQPERTCMLLASTTFSRPQTHPSAVHIHITAGKKIPVLKEKYCLVFVVYCSVLFPSFLFLGQSFARQASRKLAQCWSVFCEEICRSALSTQLCPVLKLSEKLRRSLTSVVPCFETITEKFRRSLTISLNVIWDLLWRDCDSCQAWSVLASELLSPTLKGSGHSASTQHTVCQNIICMHGTLRHSCIIRKLCLHRKTSAVDRKVVCQRTSA